MLRRWVTGSGWARRGALGLGVVTQYLLHLLCHVSSTRHHPGVPCVPATPPGALSAGGTSDSHGMGSPEERLKVDGIWSGREAGSREGTGRAGKRVTGPLLRRGSRCQEAGVAATEARHSDFPFGEAPVAAFSCQPPAAGVSALCRGLPAPATHSRAAPARAECGRGTRAPI